jgi:hypothetical protein
VLEDNVTAGAVNVSALESLFVVATFSDSTRLLDAVRAMRAEQYRIYDVYAPYPVHGLDEAMGIRRTRLPWVTLVAGICGAVSAFGFQFFAAVADWPMNVGGKPDQSALAFVPITFELTVLVSALVTVACLLLRGKLFPGKRARLVAEGVTNDTFALALRKRDNSFDVRRVRELLQQSGAREVRLTEEGA